MSDMRRRTEDIVRYYGELSRRLMTTSGLDGIPHLLEVQKQLEMAMAEVGSQEIEWAADEIRRLLDALAQMDAKLQRLRALKMVVSGPAATTDGARRTVPAR